MKIACAVLVVLTVAVHFAFIAYMVTGGFLALKWPKTIWMHIPAVIWGIAIELIDFVCPLTALERRARPRAGMGPMPADGFIDHYLTGVVYPASWANLVLVLALLTVVTSWVLFARSRRRQTISAGRARS
ncbi:DUF2784 domain-containing protein [Mycolicibacterium komossense]|uniref:DUF2784 domain-containing protein n=1 Tax=Mycolicibacterium komossense TaxID=1779 RepID=A0ABT3C8Z9_9MYCO|nr:DUF2784 domain-containing protein [Mycolicibacterium komossense]MCV7225939.1 DUF2784 domain-containing protein [Mycolicibacterium komossense]